jgi:hypothetical protein
VLVIRRSPGGRGSQREPADLAGRGGSVVGADGRPVPRKLSPAANSGIRVRVAGLASSSQIISSVQPPDVLVGGTLEVHWLDADVPGLIGANPRPELQ